MTIKEQIALLTPFISENRIRKIDRVLDQRTKSITLVLENIYLPQNASAVLRTCECFGIQDVHIIENNNSYRVNPRVVIGASKWLSIHRYNNSSSNTVDCISNLKSQGYIVYATTLSNKAMSIDTIVPDHKMAIIMGNERTGISEEASKIADYSITIPMCGFTDSFNLSVSSSIILHSLLSGTNKINKISSEERDSLKLEWYKKIVRRSELILKRC